MIGATSRLRLGGRPNVVDDVDSPWPDERGVKALEVVGRHKEYSLLMAWEPACAAQQLHTAGAGRCWAASMRVAGLRGRGSRVPVTAHLSRSDAIESVEQTGECDK